MDLQEYDRIIRTLVGIAAHQETITQDLRAVLDEQRGFNRQQVAINTAVQTTLARMETLLARMLRQERNGHDA